MTRRDERVAEIERRFGLPRGVALKLWRQSNQSIALFAKTYKGQVVVVGTKDEMKKHRAACKRIMERTP
jgi:hypothetical protein